MPTSEGLAFLASLKSRLAEIQESEAVERLRRLRLLCEENPAFYPAQAALGVAEQLNDDASDLGEPSLPLVMAVEASDRAPEAVLELAHYVYVLDNDPESAKALFLEVIERCEWLLVDAWVGLLGCWEQTGEVSEISRVAREVPRRLPHSPVVEQKLRDILPDSEESE